MNRRRFGRWLGGLLGLGLVVSSGWAQEATEGATATPNDLPAGDARLLDEIIARHGIDANASPPGFDQYLRDVGQAFGETLSDWLSGPFGEFAVVASGMMGWIGYGLLMVLAAVILFFLGRALWRRRDRKVGVDTSVQRLDAQVSTQAPGVPWDQALQQALEVGDVARAIEALWWWLAQCLHRRIDASWTSRELVIRAQRRDLLPQVRRLDRLHYSAQTPEAGDVAHLWQDLRRLLPATADSAPGGAGAAGGLKPSGGEP